jgi:hypothetical protein
MRKTIKISTCRNGLTTSRLDIDNETIALRICDNKKDSEIIKEAFIKRMCKNGILLKHQKDIYYKRPFWKFWGLKDYNISVFKISIEC